MFSPSAGVLGGAVQLSPTTNDFVSMGDTFDFGGSLAFTIQAWIKLAPGDTIPMMPVSKHLSTVVSGYFLAVNDVGDGLGAASVNKAHFWESGAFTGPSSTVVNDGQWHQLVGVYDGALAQLYVDGALQNAIAGVPITTNSVDFLVGGLNGSIGVAGAPANLFRGLIDEVQVYNNALSVAQVQQLYENVVSTVPEPSSITLLAIGGLAWIGRRWRTLKQRPARHHLQSGV